MLMSFDVMAMADNVVKVLSWMNKEQYFHDLRQFLGYEVNSLSSPFTDLKLISSQDKRFIKVRPEI